MSFLFPNFLYFLTALSIPIVIHLFNFRRYKKIAFTNVHLLREIEFKSKSVKQLKNYLILACRLMALTFLILAFAQPFLPASTQVSDKINSATVIYIDNSFSLNENNGGHSKFSKVKTAISTMVNELDNSSGLYILSNDFKQSELNKLSKNEAQSYMADIEISAHSRNLIEIGHRLEVILNEKNETSIRAYLFSDFQKSQFRLMKIDLDSNIELSMVKLEEPNQENVSIDSCWLSSNLSNLSESDSLYIKVENFSNDDLTNHPLRTYVNDQQISLSSLDIPAFSNKVISIPLNIEKTGFYKCKVNTTDNGIEEDNSLYFSLLKDSLKRIYHLGSEEFDRYFSAVYQSSGEYRSDNIRNSDIGFLSESNTFILSPQSGISTGLISELKNKVLEGANLIIYANDSSSIKEMNEVLQAFDLESIGSLINESADISKVNISSSILRTAIEKMPDNPIYPSSNIHFKLTNKASLSKEDLLSFENNDAALRKYELAKGNVFLYTFPFSEKHSNFVKHPLFVALSINCAIYKRYSPQLYYVLGEKNLIPLEAGKIGSEIIHVQSSDIDVIPELKQLSNKSFILLHQQVEKANNYVVSNSNGQIDQFSMNYARKESDPRVYSEEELTEVLNENGENLKLFNAAKMQLSASSLIGNPSQFLWKYCIILALMFFLFETLIIKFMKT